MLALLMISPLEGPFGKHVQAEQHPSAHLLRPAAWQEGQIVAFDPCDGGFVDDAVNPEQRIVQFANLPAWVVTGWGEGCPARWTLAGLLHRNRNSIAASRSEFALASILCLLISLQWLLIGGFPLVRARRWLAEPGTLITICSVAAGALVLLSWMDGYRNDEWIAEFPMLIVPFAWLWWFALLSWTQLRLIRDRLVRHQQGLS